MICEFLHPIFDALDAELTLNFDSTVWGVVGNADRSRALKQIGNAKNLRCINQRKGFSTQREKNAIVLLKNKLNIWQKKLNYSMLIQCFCPSYLITIPKLLVSSRALYSLYYNVDICYTNS